MSQSTPFFKAFGPLLFGRAPKSPLSALLQELRSSGSLSQLMGACGELIPRTLLKGTSRGDHSRMRHYNLSITFYAFLAQVLSPGSACREIVRRVQAWHASIGSGIELSSQTTAYCAARAKLPSQTLELVARHLGEHSQRRCGTQRLWHGRSVKIVDGTTLSMPDTPANQEIYPQHSSQKPGLGFPIMRVAGLFSLAGGTLIQLAKSSLHVHESMLFRQLWSYLQRGDVLLADRGFCSYHAMVALLERGVDSVLCLNQTRKTDMRHGRRQPSGGIVAPQFQRVAGHLAPLGAGD